MAPSNPGIPGSGTPTRAPGRGFASADPERQREIDPDAPTQHSAPDRASATGPHPQEHGGVPGRPAPSRAAAERIARPSGAGAQATPPDNDHEGGSSRRTR